MRGKVDLVTTREGRVVENQDLFRRANQALEKALRGKVSEERPIPFLCECLDESCRSSVEITLTEYDRVRAYANRYVILPGHPTADGEEVIEEDGRRAVVEKN
jgi:hypothetical protein